MGSVEVKHSGSVAVVAVMEPQMVYEKLESIQQQVGELIQKGARRVVINLSAVQMMDSSGVGLLMELNRKLDQQGGILKLAAVQPRIRSLLSMTRLDRVLDVHENEGDAVASFSAPQSLPPRDRSGS
ncbi:MAG TPA: STAS domain-containing protein [Acidobacteriota bacterium]|jgi:anti-sigma B factor antagonist